MIVFKDADTLIKTLNLEGDVWGSLPIYMTSGGFDPLHIGHARCILETTDIGAIEKLKPTYFTKGGDRARPEDIPEWDICQEVECDVLFNVGGGKIQSSSWLLRKLENEVTDEI